MAKTLKDAPVTTRSARAGLGLGVHWRRIDPEVHLGYRKGKRGGVWLVRWRNVPGYRQEPLGTADDALKEGTLDYATAERAARIRVDAARAEIKALADGPPITVRGVVEHYISERDERQARRAGRPIRSDSSRRLSRHLLGQPERGQQKAITAAPLAGVALNALTESDLSGWRDGLRNLKETTKRRLANDLKAALNAAYTKNQNRLGVKFSAVVKHGLKADKADEDDDVQVARQNQILTDAQVSRLVSAAREVDEAESWEGDLFRIVVTLAATGARFSQIARMCVRDFQRIEARLIVPASRKGRGSKGAGIPIPIGADTLEVLTPAVIGRPKDGLLLERWRHKQIGHGAAGIRWERSGRGPWKAAAEMTRPWELIRIRAEMPAVIPYALRHSSAVRGIRANLPIRLVAALHDTSVSMIERHYGRWIADGLDELAARAVVPLVPRAGGDVVHLARKDNE